ncbi:MAG: LPS assembly protein LptD [Azonexus sp.]|jgi:LPS-assembly protein|uniref:LPS-assembly protein LptD n=1 Tax=Azonexus sp. TaxID=1872668 RepID=UPI00282B5495|nr:LPS assembly protein LptD [Azonexus sp.]MDR0776627.1 LPS assembly protein LptD [Azonexus sp.]
MPGFSQRPLAVCICCLFAGLPAAHAAAADDDAPLRLRQERRFNVMAGKGAQPAAIGTGLAKPAGEDDRHPLFLIADHMDGQDGQNGQVAVAEGNVELRRAGLLLFADRVVYKVLDDEVEASGNVRLMEDGAVVNTPWLRLRLADTIGHTEQVDYNFVRQVKSEFYRGKDTVVAVAANNYSSSGAPMMLNVPNTYGLPTVAPERRPSEASGRAERLDFAGKNQFRFTRATYSTCKPGQDDWRLQAETMHLDYDREVGTVRNATLRFQEMPIFYLPTGSFSLNGQRQSGFLHPTLVASSKNGLDVSIPYYWNIAPNYDATIQPRYMAKRGLQLGVEGRYFDYNYSGVTQAEYMARDQQRDERRYAYHVQHQHNLGRGVSAMVDWQGVSDDLYWEDMSSRLLRTAQTQLLRQALVSYAPTSWLSTSVEVLRYQTLQPDPKTPISRPYFLEPRINFNIYKPNLFNTDTMMTGQYSRFTHTDTVNYPNGERLVMYPQVSLPIIHPAFQITPKFGLHMTRYQMDQALADGRTSVTRSVPTFTLDSTVVFERETRWLDNNYIQTLEPRLYYVNIPYRDQGKLPLFDTALADFDFAQIFSENRYSGFDRVNDANQLTAALTSRLLDPATGTERFKAMIGQRYYFKSQRVLIPGETMRQKDFSNLIAAVSGVVLPKTYVDAAWEYNYNADANERFSLGARYHPDFGKVLSASYRFVRDPMNDQRPLVEQVDIGGQWPITSRWYAVGRYNYSLRDSQLLEAIGGVEYNAGCWSLRVVGQRLAALSGAPNTSLFIQLELNDFASIGSNPLSLLRRSIAGYGKTNELPTGGSQDPFQ